MGDETLTRDAYSRVHDSATDGGKTSATADAEERFSQGEGFDPLVDPKGLPHLGPIRLSLPRFAQEGNLWVLTCGLPMAMENLRDCTGSMGNNVDLAFDALMESYEMMVGGLNPVLGRYDVQMANGIFNDVEDNQRRGIPVILRSQFEMGEKIPLQLAMLIPGRGGCGNGKEDPQFGLFGAAYLTAASINRWGLKYYHFTISDEPVVPRIDFNWLKKIFGDNVLDYVKENGYDMDAKSLPDTRQVIMDLQSRAHAFFLQVDHRPDVTSQWKEYYGADHFIMLPDGTRYLHGVEGAIAGLTEGVLDLQTVPDFLQEHKVPKDFANRIVRAIAHIPLGAQTLFPNFHRLPKAGDRFREKTDLWPIDDAEAAALNQQNVAEAGSEQGPKWL